MRPRIKLGASPATCGRLRSHSLEEHEIQQVAYHLGALAVDDPIVQPTRLAAAAQTVHEVRVLIKHGRGNVAADIAPTNGYNGVAASVVKHGRDIDSKSARAIVMGAGVCNHYAGLAAVVHAPRMDSNDTMAVTAGNVDLVKIEDGSSIPVRGSHVLVEWRTEGGRDGDSTAVMDAWANGPAVRLKDSAWVNADGRTDVLQIGSEEAAQRKDRVGQLASHLHPANNEQVARQLDWYLAKPENWDLYAEAQVVSTDFARRASDALSEMAPAKQRQLAGALAQQAYNLTAEKAASPRMLAAVLDQAHRLDHQARPRVVAPEA